MKGQGEMASILGREMCRERTERESECPRRKKRLAVEGRVKEGGSGAEGREGK